jgi:hypothetical protein
MSVDGNWELVIDSPMGKQDVLIEVKEADGELTGTLHNKTNNQTTEIFDGKVTGDDLTWKAKMQQVNITLTFNTSVQGDAMSGKMKAGMFGSFKVSGQRV